MALALFDHKQLRQFDSIEREKGEFCHSFGGDSDSLTFLNVEHPFQIVYSLDLADPRVVQASRFDGSISEERSISRGPFRRCTGDSDFQKSLALPVNLLMFLTGK